MMRAIVAVAPQDVGRDHGKTAQDLLNEESMLAQQIAADQGRWSDVNSQLDELERSLTVPIKQ